jgi:OOP family OmpA-OmpF porin
MGSIKRIAACGLASLCMASLAHADETGIYAGLSVGESKTDFSNNLDDFFDGKDTAFKIYGGYRILDWVGVEASYVDLGEITQRGGNQPGFTPFRLEEAGFGAYGVLYWNIAPVDLFAKGGLVVSQVHTRGTVQSGIFRFTFDETDSSTDLTWGVGAQVRFGKLAVRAEYEHFDIDAGSGFDAPDMVSIGATWTFF